LNLTDQIIELFIPLVSFFINIVIQLSINKFNKNCGLLKSELYGFVIGLLFQIFFEVYYNYLSFIYRDTMLIVIANIIIYCCLGYCYFHFVNLAITARRIKILRLLYAHNKGLTYHDILNKYDAKEMIDNRIDRLIGSGQINIYDGRFIIGNSTMLFISKIILLLKMLIIGKKSEFD